MMSAAWVFCDRCGCSVDVELIDEESHHYDAHGDFYCADCWAARKPSTQYVEGPERPQRAVPTPRKEESDVA